MAIDQSDDGALWQEREEAYRHAEACNAWIAPASDLAAQRAASRSRVEHGDAGALEGLTVSVKDNIALAGMPTTGGSPALASYRPDEGTAIARMRHAGALFVGKTNLHELAFGITGTNAHTGPALNPFNTQHLAGGSSSGAAISVATGACAVAIGTDTGGSCRIPAAHCGVVGFRPSTYRYPIDGYLRLSPSRDTLGLIARSTADIASVDAVVSGEPGAPAIPDFKDLRLGVVRNTPLADAVAQNFEDALSLLSNKGVTLVDVDLSAPLAADNEGGFGIALYETTFSAMHLAERAGYVDYAAFLDAVASEDVKSLLLSQLGDEAVTHAQYQHAVALDLPKIRQGMAAAMEGVDALVYPTTALTAPRRDIGEMVQLGGQDIPVFPAYTMMTRVDSMAGVPTLSLPNGLADGLPTGFQLTGRAGQDRYLLALGALIEHVLPDCPLPSLPGEPT